MTTPGVYLQATASPGDCVALLDRGAGAQIFVYNDSAALAFLAGATVAGAHTYANQGGT